MIFVYRLICPIEKTVKYIGITSDLNRRFSSHRSEYTSKEKMNWIKSLRKKRLIPKIEIIDMVECSRAKEFELHYINLYISNGFNLLNVINNPKKKKVVKIKVVEIDKSKLESTKRVQNAKNYLKSIKNNSFKKPIK